MKNGLVLLLLSLWCLSAAMAESVIVDTEVLLIRDQPEGQRLSRVYQGQQFVLLEQREGWGKVEYAFGETGWFHLDYTRPVVVGNYQDKIPAFCASLNQEFNRINWKDIHCDPSDWQANFTTTAGSPLLYTIMGDHGPNTLLACTVHGDEATTYHCFRLMKWLKANQGTLRNRLVIVPLLNPEGFLNQQKTRTNGNGVDLNRNMPSKDWYHLALKSWQQRYNSDQRRYPGPQANSEPETNFMVHLIHTYKPDKVISLHSPYNFLDLDFVEQPHQNTVMENVKKNAEALAIQFSKRSKMRFINYQTFPGSLGRFGAEWRIPIYTLEMPSAEVSMAEKYFGRFKNSLIHSLNVILDERKMVSTTPQASTESMN